MASVSIIEVQALKETAIALVKQLEKIEMAIGIPQKADKSKAKADGISLAERNAAKRYR